VAEFAGPGAEAGADTGNGFALAETDVGGGGEELLFD
jgi:hypothetical protein